MNFVQDLLLITKKKKLYTLYFRCLQFVSLCLYLCIALVPRAFSFSLFSQTFSRFAFLVALACVRCFCYIYKWFRAHMCRTAPKHTRTAVATICNCSAFITAGSFDVLAAVFRCSPLLAAFCFSAFPGLAGQCLHTRSKTFVGRQQTIKHLRYIAYQRDRDMAEGIGYWLLGTCSFRCGLGLVFDLPFGKAENVLTCGLPEFSTRLSVRFCCFSQLPHFKNA